MSESLHADESISGDFMMEGVVAPETERESTSDAVAANLESEETSAGIAAEADKEVVDVPEATADEHRDQAEVTSYDDHPSPMAESKSPAETWDSSMSEEILESKLADGAVEIEQETTSADEPEVSSEANATLEAEVTQEGQSKKRLSDVLPDDLSDTLSPGKKHAPDNEQQEEILSDEIIEKDVEEMKIEKKDSDLPEGPNATADSVPLDVAVSQEYDPNCDPIIVAARERRMEMEAKLEQTKQLMDKMKQGLIHLTNNIDEVKGSFQDLNERADRVVEESKAHTEGLKDMKERMAKINEIRAENDAKFRDQVTALKEKVMGILEKEKENLEQVKAIDKEVKNIAVTTNEALTETKADEETMITE